MPGAHCTGPKADVDVVSNREILAPVRNWTLTSSCELFWLILTWELLRPIPGADLLQPWPALFPQGLKGDHQTPPGTQFWGADLPHVHPLDVQTTVSLLHQWRWWTAGITSARWVWTVHHFLILIFYGR
jgi:hypothetical protein